MEEMQRQLEAFKHQRNDHPARSTGSSSVADLSNVSPLGDTELDWKVLFDYDQLQRSEYSLGDCTLEKEMVISIYKIFANHFHPHLPILEPTISIDLLHKTSPLLFWTIIAVVLARRIKPDYAQLFSGLKASYVAQLNNDILNAPLPLHVIQAMLILINFPFPVDRQSKEPSWLYCGLAVNAALYMGLQKPTPIQSLRSIGVVPGALRARASTWLACFLSSTSLSMFVGLSPLINGNSELDTIERYTREFAFPREYVYQILVQHTIAKYATVLLNDSNTAVSLAIVQLVDGELDGLKSKLCNEFTPTMEYSVLVAKLHLYAMTVVRMQSDLTSRNVLLQLGLSVSLRIVYLIREGLAYESEDNTDIPKENLPLTIPKNHYRGLVLASIFLLRYFALNNHASPEEQELARNHVAIAHTYFKSVSVEAGDEQDRGAILLASLSQQKPMDIDSMKLRVSDRLGASLVYEAITTAHELRNDNIEAEETAPKSTDDAEAGAVEQGPPPLNEDIVIPEIIDPMDLNPLDFSLPADLWGDSMWGMFDFNSFPNQTLE
ncbi:hypothetical protein BU24DRAFT_259854 [Aaosphaeria arxii CBS 175.79]|uniref:Xylanolytic transcriptional activator regulatory domain-containing protein n=1 Tax=Aaosphaeria arxii CBS 175.79 TaxID=1450172 RepID=A0A6A5XJD2_9PLEO|nr:uncharacterized protein BU24DRAFT_259854 [Aaosphaeria arxii CBS 175.79]KAF2012860.1 hypothetical protein BU24DRAFT_259854 [Aaosphaeria arxii CBS 175.79]